MKETETRNVGIDLGKRGYVLRIIDGQGKITGWSGSTTPEGRRELYRRLRATDRIAVEACNIAFIMNREFKELTGNELYILNPGKLYQIYMTDKKTDKEDALKLAKEIRDRPDEDLPRVYAPTEEMKEMRKVISEYKEVVKMRTQKINRLHGVYEHAGLTDLKKSDLETKAGRGKNLLRLSGYEKEEAERLMQIIDLSESQKKVLDKKIEAAGDENEKIRTVEQIPGIGKITAYAFVASAGDADRFESAAKLSSYLGFVPRIDCSSDTVRYGHITKKGNSYLRGLLVQAAWALVRSKRGGALKEKYLYIVAHGLSKKKAIVAIARKIAELMYTLLKTDGNYEQRKFAPQPPKTAVLAGKALATA